MLTRNNYKMLATCQVKSISKTTNTTYYRVRFGVASVVVRVSDHPMPKSKQGFGNYVDVVVVSPLSITHQNVFEAAYPSIVRRYRWLHQNRST